MSKDSKARQTKGQLVTFHPSGEYYFAKGLKAYQQRDFYKAKKYLERASELEPCEPMIYCQLAIVCTELGDFQQSNVYLHEILEDLDEHMTECHYFLANNYAHLGLFKDAYEHAQNYLKLNKDGEFVEDTEDLLDLLRLEAEEFDEDLYEQDDLIVMQEEARRLLEAGQFQKAIDLLEKVTQSYPEYWSAYNNMALAYFYLGQAEEANQILEDVLAKNNGNLHALCNKLVFAHYQKQTEQVVELVDMLAKIKPMLVEHQYKLGASFALVGEYELAYAWLKRLLKKGFEGDGPFYYWLSYASFYTGREALAEQAWKKVLELSPEKEGNAPWDSLEVVDVAAGDEEDFLASDKSFERLFGIFLASLEDDMEGAIGDYSPQTQVEQSYLDFLSEKKLPTHDMFVIHHVALGLMQHRSVHESESLFLLWFEMAERMLKQNERITNIHALAAAIEYLWRKIRGDKVTQTQVADQYGMSASTLQKYVKLVKGL